MTENISTNKKLPKNEVFGQLLYQISNLFYFFEDFFLFWNFFLHGSNFFLAVK